MTYVAKFNHGLKNFSIIDFSKLNLTAKNITIILKLDQSLKKLN